MKTRVAGLDELRGFALLGIALVNLPLLARSWESFYQPPSDNWARAGILINSGFFDGKFFTLFSFLFGAGLFLLLDNYPLRTTVRRLAGLIILGISHGLLFFPGDILVSYGILGLIFLALRKQSTRVLIFTAAFCFCLSAAAYTLLGLFSQTAPAFPAMNYLGSFGDAVRSNTRIYPLSLGFVALFNVPSAFAFFCLGFLAMREGWFPRLRFSRKSVGLLATGVMGSAFYASATAFQWKPLLPWAMLILAMTAPLLTTAYVHALLSWLASGKNARFFYAVAQAGRMSLTNYLLQSVLAGLLFHGYGFALYNRYSIAALIPVSLGIFTAEILFSLLWLRFFRYGPAEWLLRCFARWQPVALLR